MRILHLLDPVDGGDGAIAACLATLNAPGARHDLIGLGTRADAQRCHALGIPCPTWIAPPLHRGLLAWHTLRRRLAGRRPDLVTCWSLRSLSLASIALTGSRTPIIGALVNPPTDNPSVLEYRSARRALARRTIVTISETIADHWRRAGASDVRTAPWYAAPHPAPRPRSGALRRALGLAPDEQLVILLADPARAGDARRFAFLVGLLNVGGVRCAGIISSRAHQSPRSLRFIRNCNDGWHVIATDTPLVSLFPACDAALCDFQVPQHHPLYIPREPATTCPSSGPILVAAATSAGLTVVIPDCPFAAELKRDDPNILPAADASPPHIAGAILHAFDLAASARAREPRAPVPGTNGAFPHTLVNLWQELLNIPRPGFPLAPDRPVPEAIQIHTRNAAPASPISFAAP